MSLSWELLTMMRSINWSVRRPVARDEATPVGIAIGLGAVLMVVAGLVAALVSVSQPGWRFAVIAISVGIFAAVSLDQLALGAVALLGFLIFDGFLEGRFGELSWHGSADLWRLLLLVVVGALGMAVGEGYRWVRDVRSGLRANIAIMVPQPDRPEQDETPYVSMKEEEHGA